MKNGDGPIQLLLVDDDGLTREVLTLQILAQGYQVETVDSGDAALRRLQRTGQRPPDVVLTDMQMPGISGLELSRQLRMAADGAGSPGMVLLAMSASTPEENLTGAFDGFLLKPFTMKQLAAMLNGSANEHGAGEAAPSENNLDESVYLSMAATMQPSQLQQLYTLCIDDAEGRIGRMRLAAAAADESAFRKEAHAIKGGCSMVGAIELHRLAAAAEENGIAPANHVVSLDEMLMACERLRRILVARKDRATL
jgi:CheY-like chemotaxis protein